MKSPRLSVYQSRLFLRLVAVLLLLLFGLCAGDGQSAGPPVLMSIGLNFTGVHYGSLNTDSGALPPDCNGTIGPQHFVQFVNGIFAVYNKTNGQRLQIETDLDFWANAGVSIDTSSWEVTDPRVLYDSTSQRWFASQVDASVDDQISGFLGNNHFLLAVSLSADPTGQWQGAMFDSDPANGNFADFPTLGVDSAGVYISGDMFDGAGDPSTAAPLGPTLVSIPKADMLIPSTNGPDISRRTWFGIMSYAQRGQVLQPVNCFDGSTPGSIFSIDDIGNTSAPHSNLVTWAVQNVVSSNAAVLTQAIFTPTTPWMVPDNVAAGAPLLTPTQPDGTRQLQANDARISARVYGINGVLYAVHNTELNNRIAIQYYRMRASDGVLLESATIADTNLDLFFPSIAANTNGTVVIGCNGCSGSTNKFISAYAVAGQIVNGTTVFGTPLLLKASRVNYHGDDEALAQALGGPVLSRWGDYSATSVDPDNANQFWTTQMWASDTDVWDTVITELITTPVQNLNIAVSSSVLALSWPTSLSGYHLQSSPDPGSAANWSNVTQTPATNGATLSVQVPMVASRSFFRLEPP